MTIAQQLLWGSVCLLACLILHVIWISIGVDLLWRSRDRLAHQRRFMRTTLVIVLAVGAMLIAITAQVLLWSFFYVSFSALEDWNTALYFSMVTFTTLGYGDIILEPDLRIFATFGAVTGLFSFGLSTAFLVAAASHLMNGVVPDHNSGENRRDTGAP
ncbi:ion channel [Sedimentitalea arenosa]|uniref:Two pore domain potassium channel family protein n=1 Tax=Sedimentitalea arenosa TaxID=2798803 RepID=A0A8J7J1D8_9RHOB|nr:potassium channel family protein [Arenibacterium arenosum]MBJ6370535.1 two pore domain potassium channel family protein [Arenibacterium arenosum]